MPSFFSQGETPYSTVGRTSKLGDNCCQLLYCWSRVLFINPGLEGKERREVVIGQRGLEKIILEPSVVDSSFYQAKYEWPCAFAPL